MLIKFYMIKSRFTFYFRESEGAFQYGNYCREADDLRNVVEFFHSEKRLVAAVIGHSKGLFFSEELVHGEFSFSLEDYTGFRFSLDDYIACLAIKQEKDYMWQLVV